MVRVNWNDHICTKERGREKSELRLFETNAVLQWTLVNFADQFELKGNRLMSRIRLFAKVCVNLDIGYGRDINWCLRRIDGRRVSGCHLAG